MTTISPNIIDAVKVQFLKPIFEDDFVERGMKAWLTKVEWDDTVKCYKLHFDFTEFEAENDKYLTISYWPNTHTAKISTDRRLFNAKEAGYYNNKTWFYLSVGDEEYRDDEAFTREITDYLRVIE